MRLAELCNTAPSYIGQIEIGNRFPSLDMIEKMAKALQIKPNLLFFEEADMALAKTVPHQKPAISNSAKEDLIQRLTVAVRRVVNRTN